MEDSCNVQVQIINYLEKAIEAQPKWVQRLFEKENIFFTISGGDTIGVQFTEKVPVAEKQYISARLKQYMEENPCELTKEKEPEVFH